MDYIEDLKMVYKKSINLTFSRIKKNSIVLILPLIYSILISLSEYILYNYLGGIGMILGFVVFLVYSLILSSYFEILSDLNSFNRISLSSISSSFTRNVGSIYSVYFIYYLIKLVVPANMFILLFLLFIILNPISEAIYIRNESYIGAYKYTLDFMKENFLHWLIPLFLYLSVIISLFGLSRLISLSSDVISITTGLKVSYNDLINSPIRFVEVVFVQVITAFYVVFRGALFNILSKSTMRKRKYMGEI